MDNWYDNLEVVSHFLCEEKGHNDYTTTQEFDTSEFLGTCLEHITHNNRSGIDLKGAHFSFPFVPSAIKRNAPNSFGVAPVSVIGNNRGGDDSYCVVEIILDPIRKSQKLTVRFYNLRAFPAIIHVE